MKMRRSFNSHVWQLAALCLLLMVCFIIIYINKYDSDTSKLTYDNVMLITIGMSSSDAIRLLGCNPGEYGYEGKDCERPVIGWIKLSAEYNYLTWIKCNECYISLQLSNNSDNVIGIIVAKYTNNRWSVEKYIVGH